MTSVTAPWIWLIALPMLTEAELGLYWPSMWKRTLTIRHGLLYIWTKSLDKIIFRKRKERNMIFSFWKLEVLWLGMNWICPQSYWFMCQYSILDFCYILVKISLPQFCKLRFFIHFIFTHWGGAWPLLAFHVEEDTNDQAWTSLYLDERP